MWVNINSTFKNSGGPNGPELLDYPCPDSHEFREDQCAAYNTIPLNGLLYEWVPHYTDDGPCALTCKGKPIDQEETDDDFVMIVETLSKRVRDGTRCRPGSLDMCIDGKCQRVGCDLQIGSDKQVDACGVCGGDGSSCSKPLYYWTLTYTSLCSATCGGESDSDPYVTDGESDFIPSEYEKDNESDNSIISAEEATTSTHVTPKTTRKRKRNVQEWKRNKITNKRLAGQEYESRGKMKRKKCVQEYVHTCRYQCGIFNEDK
ncbi:unnamed protein product [Diabrotica balteata]|uniref:ADAMTS/ADAMTS-like cysteine-rich domain-containing protein n=1 Tax=Diabrotica balteata TaxID=107213 RepID=A0A9N9XE30_DIABA|nr:unnamed protein product [Diabrotica balteata]